jgi:hypothetical protein
MPGEYLSPNDVCELNYTRGQGLHLAEKVGNFFHRLCRLGCEHTETLRSVSKISVHTCLGPLE